MQDEKQTAALESIFDDLLGRNRKNALAPPSPVIDVRSPTQHPSKSAFLLELNTVENSQKHVDGLLEELLGTSDQAEEVEEMRISLGDVMDEHGFSNLFSVRVPESSKMVVEVARLAGLRVSFLRLLLEVRTALGSRRKELKDQEKEFWTVSRRPPNYYARTIALRTARLYAREKGERPKYGTQRDSGEPSTSFARGLKRIFEVLEIDAGIRGPAEWAIGQLTDEDLKPPQNALMGELLGLGPSDPSFGGIGALPTDQVNALSPLALDEKKGS